MANFDERLARYASEFSGNKNVGGDKPNYFDLPNGTIKARILPSINPDDTTKDFFCKTLLHYNVSPTNPKIPVICGKANDPLAFCYICRKQQQLSATGSNVDKAVADKLKPVARYYIALILREGPRQGEVVVYPARKVLLSKLLSIFKDTDYGDVTDLSTGRDVKLTRTGSGRETDYDIIPVPVSTPAGPDLRAIKMSIPPLYRFAVPPDQDEVVALMNGDVPYLKTGGMSLTWTPDGLPSHKGVEEDTTEPDESFEVTPTPPPAPKKAKSDAIRKILEDDSY